MMRLICIESLRQIAWRFLHLLKFAMLFQCILCAWITGSLWARFALKFCENILNSHLHVFRVVHTFGSWGLIPIVTLSLIFALVNKSRAIDWTLINSQLAAPLSPPLRVCSLREVQSSGPSMTTAGCVAALSSIIKDLKILRPPAACNHIHTFHISDPYFSALGKLFLCHHLLNWSLMASATFISFYLSFF